MKEKFGIEMETLSKTNRSNLSRSIGSVVGHGKTDEHNHAYHSHKKGTWAVESDASVFGQGAAYARSEEFGRIMTTQELIADLRSRINPAYANQRHTESYERRLCVEALEAQAMLIERFRRIAAHVPAKIYIEAKESAGFGARIQANQERANVQEIKCTRRRERNP